MFLEMAVELCFSQQINIAKMNGRAHFAINGKARSDEL